MQFLHVTVCGFIIRIEFHPSVYPRNVKIMHELFIYTYKSLLLKKPAPKADYVIKIMDADWIDMVLIKKKDMNFINLFKTTKKGEIVTTYFASPILFQMMFMQILEELSKDNGILIHASSAVINGKASLFCGVSGAGKSTAITLLRNTYRAIAEDTVYLTTKENKLIVYQTPFIEKLPWLKRGNSTFDVGNIFFLIQDKSCKVKEIKSKERAFDEFMKRFAASKRTYKNQLKLSLELVLNSPCYYLYFNKNSNELIKVLSSLP